MENSIENGDLEVAESNGRMILRRMLNLLVELPDSELDGSWRDRL